MAPLVIERVTRQVPPLTIAGKDVRSLVTINRSSPWPAGAAVLVTNVRRHAVYNKSPEELRALNRSKQSISNSVAFDAPVVQIEPVHYDSAHVVVLTTSGEVSLVVLKDMPDGSISAAATALVKVPGATCVAVVQEQGTAHKPTDPLANKSLAIFGANKAGAPFHALVESLATTEAATVKTVEGTPFKQPWAAAFGAPTKAAAGPYGFIAVAGAAGGVVVVRAPALGTAVTPSAVTAHSEGGLGFLAFATVESAALGVDFSEAAKAGATTVFVTASGSGHEVRLWGLSATGVTDLLQTFNVTGDASSRLILMDPLSELVVLQSREATGTIMALQLAASRTSIVRVTEWSVEMAPLAGSMAFASAGEVALVGRVEKGLVRVVLDEARLRGAANVDGVEARPNAARAGALTSGAREIVSNKRGQRTVTLEEARADPAASGAALAEFTAAIHEQLAAAGAEIASLDRQVGDALNALRHPEALKSLKEAARSTAVSALAETAAARPAAAAGNGTVALSSSSFAPVLEPEFFGDWLKAISQYTEKVVAKAYRDHIDLNIAVAVDRVWPRVKRSLEREAPAVERVAAMDAYRGFEQQVARHEVERKELVKRQVNASQTKMSNLEETLPAMYSAMDKAASYERLLAAELATLGGAITAAKANISKASAKYAPVEVFDVEAALASLLKSAQAGDFAAIASTLASSGNLGLVVRFLEHEDSRADEVVSASHLTVGAFTALARLLAQNLDNAPAGTAPARVKWLKALALAFDPEFAPATIVTELRSIKGQLQPVHDMLAIVKGDQRMNREALVARKSFAAMLSA